MKPASIIFLIVSIVIVIAGFATAGIAGQLAAAEGIELGTPRGEDGNYVYTYEYDTDSIGKITVDAKDAEVNVIGGAAKPYVELINFAEGMYDFSSSNRVLSISDGADMTSFAGIASMVVNFKGLRTFVNYYGMKNLDRTVNIYVCEDYPVNVIEVSLEGGTVNIKDNKTKTDYYVNVTSGEVNMMNVTTTSAVNIEMAAGNINVNKCELEEMSAELTAGNINASAGINRFRANVITGDVDYACYGKLSGTNLKLFANVGSITLDGDTIGGYMETNEVATHNLIDISVSTGDVTIKSNTPR